MSKIQDEELIDEIEDAIRSLETCAKRPKSYTFNMFATKSMLNTTNNNENTTTTAKSSFVERNVDSGEKS